MHPRRTFLAMAAAPLLLEGCATMSSIADGAEIGANQGLLAFHVETDRGLSLLYQAYDPSRSSAAIRDMLIGRFGAQGGFDISRGSRWFVTPVDAGEYMWSRLESGNYYTFIGSSNRFTIKRRTLTYVGHLRIRPIPFAMTIIALDQEAEARDYLKASFPKYTQDFGFEKVISEFRVN